MPSIPKVQKSIALRIDQVRDVRVLAEEVEKHGSFSRVIQDMVDQGLAQRRSEIDEVAKHKQEGRAA